MRGEKLRVWFAPEDMQGGQKLIEPIDRAIQVNDRLLLVLAEHSLNSEWVQTEIRKARQAERALGAGLPTPPLVWTPGRAALRRAARRNCCVSCVVATRVRASANGVRKIRRLIGPGFAETSTPRRVRDVCLSFKRTLEGCPARDFHKPDQLDL